MNTENIKISLLFNDKWKNPSSVCNSCKLSCTSFYLGKNKQ